MLAKLKQIKRYCTFHAASSLFSALSIVSMFNKYPLVVTSVKKNIAMGIYRCCSSI